MPGRCEETLAFRARSFKIRLTIPKLHQPFARYFRRKRFRRFWRAFGLSARTRVLDVGGYEYYWRYFDQVPRVTMLNLDRSVERTSEFDWVIADARQMPFACGAFDVVFANSIIEHVGDQESRLTFAAEVQRTGKRYYVQTPNQWFPVEPHLWPPFIHYLPAPLQKRLLRNFTVWGWLVRPTQQGCDEFVDQVRLLTLRELQALFPEAEIWKERLLGWTKSLIAVSHRP